MASNRTNTDLGLLMIRFGAFLMFFHGLNKLMTGHGGVRQQLADHNLPDFLWVGVPVAEVIAPVLILLGIFTRIGGLLYVVLMLFAMHFSGWDRLVAMNEKTGALGVEANLLFLFCGLCLFFAGGGKYVLYKPRNYWLG